MTTFTLRTLNVGTMDWVIMSLNVFAFFFFVFVVDSLLCAISLL
jgi:hypothetical protein